jgi:hypothetical protein
VQAGQSIVIPARDISFQELHVPLPMPTLDSAIKHDRDYAR